MAKALGLFRDSQPLLGSLGPRPMYRLNLLLIGPDDNYMIILSNREL
jgi:hypothetical protein